MVCTNFVPRSHPMKMISAVLERERIPYLALCASRQDGIMRSFAPKKVLVC